MVGFHPFHGHLIRPEFVRRVPAPAFDSMSVAERTEYLKTHPESYTLVTRSPGDGGPDDAADSNRLHDMGAAALDRILAENAFAEIDGEVFFLYRLSEAGHDQLGVVGLVDVEDYLSGRIKRHERVAASRAHHLSVHFERLGVQSSPIALGYRHDISITERLDALVENARPTIEFTSGDGLSQAVWIVDDPVDCRAISDVVSTHELYIMDGHHRAAASGVLHERLGERSTGRMLAVLFDNERINIAPFHRRVIIPEHLDLDDVHTALVEILGLEPDPMMVSELPSRPDEVGVFSNGEWWSGVLPEPEGASPLAAIDPVRLQDHVIGPVLGIDPAEPGGMLGYFLDTFDRNDLSRFSAARELFFVLRPVTTRQVFAVADAGLDMPPKSTYVTPKPRSGVFLRRF